MNFPLACIIGVTALAVLYGAYRFSVWLAMRIFERDARRAVKRAHKVGCDYEFYCYRGRR